MPWGSNVFPLLIVTARGGFTGLFVYSPGPGNGNLIASVTAQAGTDPFGNSYFKGINSIDANGVSQMLGSAFGLYSGGILIGSLHVNASGQVVYTPVGGQPLIISRNSSAVAATAAVLEVQGVLALAEIALPAAAADPQLVASNVSGMLRFVSDTTKGDSNAYDTGKLHLFNTAAVPVNSTLPVTILSAPVAAGTYEFSGIFRLKQGAVNQNQSIGFTGPAASFVNWYQKASNQSSASMGPEFAQGALNLAPSIAFGAVGNEAYVEFRGTVTFTAAGTFTMAAQNQVAGDTCTAQPGCIFDLEPVG